MSSAGPADADDALGVVRATHLDAEDASVSSSSASSVGDSSMESYVAPLKNSVTMNRERRKKAGSNMDREIRRFKGEKEAQAEDGDDEFWNQEFFKSDDEEFSEGEVDEEDRVDKFDSDFNDSESDDEGNADVDEEDDDGNQRKNVYKDPSVLKGAKRKKKYRPQPILGKRKPASKTQGTGFNRGITLGNWGGNGVSTAEMMRSLKERKEREAAGAGAVAGAQGMGMEAGAAAAGGTPG